MHFPRDIRIPLIAAALLAAGAALLPAHELVLDVPDALRPFWAALLAEHPLPGPPDDGLPADGPGAAVPGSAGRQPAPVARVLRIEVRSFRVPAGSAGAPGGVQAPGAVQDPAAGPVPAGAGPIRDAVIRKTVAREVFAPAVPLWDPRQEITLRELLRAGADTPEILPLGNIRPPLRALPVDGLHAGEEGYPLTEETVLSIEDPAGEDPDPALIAWLSDVPEATAAEPTIWIAGVGDMMLARGVQEILLSGPAGIERIFGDTIPHLLAPDILTGNLEGAVTRRGAPLEKGYTFRFLPESLGPLQDAGFDYLSLTNNHAYDYGEQGFLDTLDHLAERGIATSGAGRTPAEASAFTSLSVRGREIRLLSLGDYPVERSGFSGARDASVTSRRPGILFRGPLALEAVGKMVSPESFDVVLVHGGHEWAHEPSPEQRRFYRELVDLGADLILGSHPHVLQGIESYRGALIAHSLGNFVFPGMGEMSRAEESMILSVGIRGGEIRYVRMVPVKIDYRTLSTDRSGTILPRFLEMTRRLHKASLETAPQ